MNISDRANKSDSIITTLARQVVGLSARSSSTGSKHVDLGRASPR
jgi:hypothetical protein